MRSLRKETQINTIIIIVISRHRRGVVSVGLLQHWSVVAGGSWRMSSGLCCSTQSHKYTRGKRKTFQSFTGQPQRHSTRQNEGNQNTVS